MIKNIVFDMGGVLTQYDPDAFMAGLSAEEQTLLGQEIYHSENWRRLDRGELTEEELTDLVCSRIPSKYCETAKKLIRWYELSAPIAGMDALALRLREKGYHVYLLSNTSHAFRLFYSQIPALAHFNDYFISAEHGLLKPDPKIFQKFCSVFSLNPSECVFVDDSAANVQSASAQGFTAIQFDGDAAHLQATLEKMKIL